jgi:hypothetical protein
MSSSKRKEPRKGVIAPPPADKPVVNGFDVVFVGLVCFAKSARIALFPNGLKPANPKVTPHYPYIVVDPKSVTKEVGFEGASQELKDLGIYQIPKCQIEIRGATSAGTLDASQHDRYVPKLVAVDKTIKIDPATADAVVRVNLGNGTLQALRHPDSSPKKKNVAIISRLRVENDSDPIKVDIYEGQTKTRSLELLKNTDIAIANIAFPKDPTKLGNHFSIYGVLTKKGKIGGKPPTSSPNVTKIHRGYRIFALNIPISDGQAMCGSQGCCPPP